MTYWQKSYLFLARHSLLLKILFLMIKKKVYSNIIKEHKKYMKQNVVIIFSLVFIVYNSYFLCYFLQGFSDFYIKKEFHLKIIKSE